MAVKSQEQLLGVNGACRMCHMDILCLLAWKAQHRQSPVHVACRHFPRTLAPDTNLPSSRPPQQQKPSHEPSRLLLRHTWSPTLSLETRASNEAAMYDAHLTCLSGGSPSLLPHAPCCFTRLKTVDFPPVSKIPRPSPHLSFFTLNTFDPLGPSLLPTPQRAPSLDSCHSFLLLVASASVFSGAYRRLVRT